MPHTNITHLSAHANSFALHSRSEAEAESGETNKGVILVYCRFYMADFMVFNTKLMKVKALRKHSLHEKTAASVLLKLFISSNE